MTPEEFKRKLQTNLEEINKFIANTAPKLVGKLAVDHFKENFRKGGFNGSKWKAPQRFNAEGQFAGQKYGTLLSSTNELMNSITYRTGPGTVTITTDKVYARIHNYGGTINVPVTDKMRKFAWAKHYEYTRETGGKDSKWKGLALTKKSSLNINMPKRQFIGDSPELERIIEQKLSEQITKILL